MSLFTMAVSVQARRPAVDEAKIKRELAPAAEQLEQANEKSCSKCEKKEEMVGGVELLQMHSKKKAKSKRHKTEAAVSNSKPNSLSGSESGDEGEGLSVSDGNEGLQEGHSALQAAIAAANPTDEGLAVTHDINAFGLPYENRDLELNKRWQNPKDAVRLQLVNGMVREESTVETQWYNGAAAPGDAAIESGVSSGFSGSNADESK